MEKFMKRNKDKGSVLERYVKSFHHAIDGIVYAIKYEHNLVIIIFFTTLVLLMGMYFNIKTYEWLFCITMIGMIWGTELLNSSIEATIDLETSKIHPLAKIAKDTASSATLLFCITALIGGLVIFIPYIQNMIG